MQKCVGNECSKSNRQTDYKLPGSIKSATKKSSVICCKDLAEEQRLEEKETWKDPGFVAAMDRRIAELESGKIKGRGWEEVKQMAR